MISIIKIAQQKIATFEHQMKVHVQTINTMREKEEKMKRSPVIFAVYLSLSLTQSLLLSLSIFLSLAFFSIHLLLEVVNYMFMIRIH